MCPSLDGNQLTSESTRNKAKVDPVREGVCRQGSCSQGSGAKAAQWPRAGKVLKGDVLRCFYQDYALLCWAGTNGMTLSPFVTRVAGHLQLRKDVLLQVKLVRKQNNLTRTPSFIHTLGRPLRFIYLWLYWITECSTSPNTDNFFLTILFFYRKLSWEVSQCKNPFLKVNLFYSRVKELPAV